MIMIEELENRMVMDSEWNEIEYGVPNNVRLKRERKSYEEEERGDKEDEFISD